MPTDSLTHEGGEVSGEFLDVPVPDFSSPPLEVAVLQQEEYVEGHGHRRKERLSFGHFSARVAVVAGALILVVAFASERFGESTDNMTSELVKAREKVGDLQETVKQTRADAVDGFCATINELQRTQDDASSLATKLDSLEQTARNLGVVPSGEVALESPETPPAEKDAEKAEEVPERLTRFLEACQDKSG